MDPVSDICHIYEDGIYVPISWVTLTEPFLKRVVSSVDYVPVVFFIIKCE